MTTIVTQKKECINLTTIVFNDKLKEWINNKSETLDLITMAHWDIDDHLKFQKIMRDRFINDSYEGMLENGNKLSKSHSDFPNIYALFLLLISEADQHDNWASVIDCDIKRQVDLIDYADIMSLNNETKYIYHCLCGHPVRSHLYKIRHLKTKYELWSGSCCIKKSKIISSKDLKACREKCERKRLKEIKIREQLEEQARLNKEQFIAYEQQLVKQQKEKFSQIIQIFISPYTLKKYKEIHYEKRQLKIGRQILLNIIAKSKSIVK